MKLSISRWMTLAILTIRLAASAQQAPAPETVHIHLDPAATEIRYTLKDTLHTVIGTFKLKSGEMDVNPRTGEASGLIVVDTSSGASGNSTRDGRMKKEYLEVEKFPTASFAPSRVTGLSLGSASQTLAAGGTFTLHGGGHPLTLTFKVDLNGKLATAAAHFSIPYVAWGIKDPSIPFIKVEKEIAIDISARGTVDAGQ